MKKKYIFIRSVLTPSPFWEKDTMVQASFEKIHIIYSEHTARTSLMLLLYRRLFFHFTRFPRFFFFFCFSQIKNHIKHFFDKLNVVYTFLICHYISNIVYSNIKMISLQHDRWLRRYNILFGKSINYLHQMLSKMIRKIKNVVIEMKWTRVQVLSKYLLFSDINF